MWGLGDLKVGPPILVQNLYRVNQQNNFISRVFLMCLGFVVVPASAGFLKGITLWDPGWGLDPPTKMPEKVHMFHKSILIQYIQQNWGIIWGIPTSCCQGLRHTARRGGA